MGSPLRPSFVGVLALSVLGWAYWPTTLNLWEKWASDPQYSHGMLVPFFALFLLYRRKDFYQPAQPWPILGLGLLGLALALRGAGALIANLTLDGLSLVLSITALTFIFGGFALFRVAWPSLFFLLFMVPLPYSAERLLGAQLQQIATLACTFLLQCLGQPAISEGNLILIEDVRLGVVEACSGLRMLVTFAAFCFGAAFLMERHWVFKLIVILSIVPIALITNILRITATGLAHVYLKESAAREKVTDFLHDFNGWMMMPVGLALLLAELWLLTRLIIEKKRDLPFNPTTSYVPQSVPKLHSAPAKPIRVRVSAKGAVPPPTAMGAIPNQPLTSGREGFTWRG